MASIFQCRNVSFSYKLDKAKVDALRDVTIDVPKNKIVALCGPSGSGKSTLLNLLGLIEPMQSGDILLGDQNIGQLTGKQSNKIRRDKLGFIFQNFYLLDALKAYENVEYFLVRQGVHKEERHKRVEHALKGVGIWEERNKLPQQMSGGQRQRVAIARALAKNPEVILADEPTASLDQKIGREIMTIMRKLCHEQGVSMVVSTHDPMVLEFADHIVHLMDGKLASHQPKKAVSNAS